MSSAASSPHSTMDGSPTLPVETYTTPNGTVCTLSSAGRILSAYLQSYGYAPQDFKTTVSYQVLPPADYTGHKRPLTSTQLHQPPPQSQFQCTISLPAECPITSMRSSGTGHRSKDMAKKQASLAIVQQLVGLGEIDYNLNPTPKKSIKNPAARDIKHYQELGHHFLWQTKSPSSAAALPSREKIQAFTDSVRAKLPATGPGNAMYPQRPHAAFWDSLEPFNTSNLYPTLVEIQLGAPYTARAAECRIICLLTTKPLPIEQEHIIDLKATATKPEVCKIDASARLIRGRRLKADKQDKLDAIMTYNNALFRAHVNKPIQGDLSSAKYLVVPMKRGYKISGYKVRRRDVAWDEVYAAQGPLRTPFSFHDSAKLQEEIIDAVATLKVEFSSRFYPKHVRTDLSPLSQHPDNPKETILGALNLPEITFAPSQPILIAEHAQSTLRGGFIVSLTNPDITNKPLIPEAVFRHFATASVLKTTSAVPFLLQALDNYFIAEELSGQLSDKLSPSLILVALTCPSSNVKAHGDTYERLEMLGDALLKFLVTVYLITIKAADSDVDWDEFHVERQVMVSNRTLRTKAIGSGIVPYIRGGITKVKTWRPMGWGPEDSPKSYDNTHHNLGDKTIADVAEALVAAGFLSQNSKFDGALTIMHKLHMPLDGLDEWNKVVSNQKRMNANVRPHGLPLTVLNYTFQRPQYGRVALSLSPASGSHNAFKVLGDALLGYFLSHGLYLQYPEEGPGSLTVMHHSRHSDACLATIGVLNGVADCILNVHPDVLAQIIKYKKAILAARNVVDTTVRDAAGRWEFWAEIPSCFPISEVVYALFGAILVDSNYDIEVLRRVYQAHLLPFFDLYCVGPGHTSPHPRTVWSEMIYKRGCSCWELKKESVKTGASAKVVFHNQVIGHGTAETDAIAVRKACDEAVKRCKSEMLIEKYCTCPKKVKNR